MLYTTQGRCSQGSRNQSRTDLAFGRSDHWPWPQCFGLNSPRINIFSVVPT